MGDRIAGKVCIVTGAGSGIGRATAIRLAEEGALVTCVDRNGDAVRSTAGIGDAAFPAPADVSDDAQVRAYTRRHRRAVGASLDVAFNNAGVNLPTVFHDATDDSSTARSR